MLHCTLGCSVVGSETSEKKLQAPGIPDDITRVVLVKTTLRVGGVVRHVTATERLQQFGVSAAVGEKFPRVQGF